ncbi:MAG: hypothetical protein CBC82_07170 [Cellvibrionales bacterium TMED122]|nr:MAG: hypothetical protein CBC82_07170 [Cellvibrionales bacterium TMED122]
MKIPFLKLNEKNANHKKRLLNRFNTILNHGKILNGPEVSEFQDKLARYLKSKYVVGLSSGSSSLYLSLKALGVGKGDQVITTPFTWIITINAILETGAIPVFADIKDDFNIDPIEIKKLINSKTKAIVPVHIGGHMCEMSEISKLAKDHNLHIVEDAAQAICGSLNGIKAGKFSSVASFSLNPMKVLNAYGECGFISTDNLKLKKKIEILRHAGTLPDPKKININNCINSSLNHKIDTIQASFVIENLKNLHNKWLKRDLIAKKYDLEFNGLLQTQSYHKNEKHGRYLYISISEDRNRLYNFLKKKGIECKIFYSPLACDAPIFKSKHKGQVPISRKLLNKSISLPLHENLKMREVDYIIKMVKNFFN